MIKQIYIACSFIICCAVTKAQQTPQWTNYVLNEYGINPAAGNNSNCIDILGGTRQQWMGFPNAPKTQFLSVRGTIGMKKFSTRSWHSVGGYIEQDKNEILKSVIFSLSYAYQLKVTSKYNAAAGIRLAYRLESATSAISNPNDPALATLPATIQHFPDFTIGGRLYNKKQFYSLSIKHLYKNRLNGIGLRSKLTPQFHFIAGRKIESSRYYYSYLPSIAVKFSVLAPPAIDLNMMMFIKNKIGFGVGYRINDAIALMVRVSWKGINAAFAYEFITSKLRAGASASREIMVGASSCPSEFGADKTGCPAYDY